MQFRTTSNNVPTRQKGTLKLGLLFMAIGLAGLLATPSILAQRYLGGIAGQVSDSSGAKVAGANVEATETTTHFVTKVVSGNDGAFLMPALQPGTYNVTVEAPNFRKESRTSIVLTAGQTVQVDITMKPGTISESVEVTSETSLIDTSSPTLAPTLSTKEVTDLPNEGRNPYVMVTLAAGVVDTASGGYFQGKSSQFTNPFSGVAVQVTTDGNGGHNRLTLDGIPNDAAERFSGASYTNFVPSPEAVQEVKVENGMFDAQVGHGDGTVTNTVIRTGNNSVHGAAYYVFQDTYLNANTFEKAALNQPRNNDQVSQTGLVIDGPVIIPKLYDGRDNRPVLHVLVRALRHPYGHQLHRYAPAYRGRTRWRLFWPMLRRSTEPVGCAHRAFNFMCRIHRSTAAATAPHITRTTTFHR